MESLRWFADFSGRRLDYCMSIHVNALEGSQPSLRCCSLDAPCSCLSKCIVGQSTATLPRRSLMCYQPVPEPGLGHAPPLLSAAASPNPDPPLVSLPRSTQVCYSLPSPLYVIHDRPLDAHLPSATDAGAPSSSRNHRQSIVAIGWEIGRKPNHSFLKRHLRNRRRNSAEVPYRYRYARDHPGRTIVSMK